MTHSVIEFKGSVAKFTIGETVRGGGSVRVHLAIVKEADGSFSIVVLNLRLIISYWQTAKTRLNAGDEE